MKKIAITTGDKLGIGKEITYKALKALNIPYEQVVIIGEKIDLDYETIEINEKENGTFCYRSLECACRLYKEGKINALVTSPVSKYELHKSGYNFNGQTEAIEYILNEPKRAQMLFIARDLRVLLLTRHVALKDIRLCSDTIKEQIKILNDFLIQKCNISSPKIALCALNPHAGEGGILGREEIEILNPVSEFLNSSENINITRALSADSLFARAGKAYLENKPQPYDAVISCYHDQGLSPLKALAFDEAVNTTIGLSMIRTSPSSGTAYDIAGKNIANPNGMTEAIKLALELG